MYAWAHYSWPPPPWSPTPLTAFAPSAPPTLHCGAPSAPPSAARPPVCASRGRRPEPVGSRCPPRRRLCASIAPLPPTAPRRRRCLRLHPRLRRLGRLGRRRRCDALLQPAPRLLAELAPLTLKIALLSTRRVVLHNLAAWMRHPRCRRRLCRRGCRHPEPLRLRLPPRHLLQHQRCVAALGCDRRPCALSGRRRRCGPSLRQRTPSPSPTHRLRRLPGHASRTAPSARQAAPPPPPSRSSASAIVSLAPASPPPGASRAGRGPPPACCAPEPHKL